MSKSSALFLIIIFMFSCGSIKSGQQNKVTGNKRLMITNGTGKDLAWYTKYHSERESDDESYSYLWFNEGVNYSSSIYEYIDSLHFLGINYNDSADTLFNKTLTYTELENMGWEMIIGDQNFYQKLVLLKYPDTISNYPLSYEDGQSDVGYILAYNTNQENVDYWKIFTSADEKVAEGPIVPDYLYNGKKQKRKSSLTEVGIWYYYSNSEIIDIDTIPFNSIELLQVVDRKNNNR